MIYDRDYMRDEPPRMIRASIALIWVLVGCFLVQAILTGYGKVPVSRDFGLSRLGMQNWELWRLITFQFLHEVPWPLHVISNALGLYFFGRSAEESVGTRNFLIIYFVGGVIGGLAQVGLDWALGRPAGLGLIGASAGVSAVVAVFCRLHAMREFQFIFLFFPIRMKARTFLWVLVGGSVLGILFPGDGVAHMAHLGGVAVGVLAPWVISREFDFWPRSRKAGRIEPARVVVPFPVEARAESARPRRAPEPASDADYVSREIDPILEKIASRGLESLTSEERGKLEDARRRMERRR